MELHALQVFVRVVQTGSFTRAAEALNSQKAHLSRVVSQLEMELGVRLLARTTRALSLTEIGREFFERSVAILASVDDAQRSVQEALGEPRGVLRLSCGVEFGQIAVSHWISSYLARYPQMRVDAEFTGRVVDLVHEGFDLAIRVGELPDSSLAARRLGDLRYGLFASRDYLKRRGTPRSPRQLEAHDLLMFSGGTSRDTWSLVSGREQIQVEVEPRLRGNNHFMLRDAACAGQGIASLPLLMVQDSLTKGALVPVLAAWSRPAVPVHAVFASARYLTPKVRAFIDHALALFDAAGPSRPR